jgi:hypothetical protein
MVALVFAVTAEAVALKVALEAPAGTVTEAGVDILALLSEIATAAPEAGAGAERPTEQETVPGGVSDVGLQVSELSEAAPSTVITEPLPDAEIALPVPDEA